MPVAVAEGLQRLLRAGVVGGAARPLLEAVVLLLRRGRSLHWRLLELLRLLVLQLLRLLLVVLRVVRALLLLVLIRLRLVLLLRLKTENISLSVILSRILFLYEIIEILGPRSVT